MQGYSGTKAGIILAVVLVLSGCNILNSNGSKPAEPVSATYEFWATGGYAGSVQHTVVDSTGLAEVTYTHSPGSATDTYLYRLSSDQLDTLKTLYGVSDFYSLEGVYPASQRIMDGFTLKVACSTAIGSKSVRIDTNAPIPSGLSNLVGFLIRMTSEAMSNGQRF